jgi:hypothetical protein
MYRILTLLLLPLLACGVIWIEGGSNALWEVDFEGTGCVDGTYAFSCTAVNPSGPGLDCDYTTEDLEPSLSAFLPSNTDSSLYRLDCDSVLSSKSSGTLVVDFLWQVENPGTSSSYQDHLRWTDEPLTGDQGCRIDVRANGMRMYPRCHDGTTGTYWTMTEGTTYKVRYLYDLDGDACTIYMDSCTPGTDCANTATGWGNTSRSSCNGADSPTLDMDSLVLRAGQVAHSDDIFDMIGVCDFNPGAATKCGD